MIKVLMIGPDRGVHGGISAVVNNYYDAGLNDKVNLKYISTMKEGSKLKKLIIAVIAYFKFVFFLSKADIIHVNVASDNSFKRKAIFIKRAYRYRKKHKNKPCIVIHQHGGNIDNYYKETCDDKSKSKIRHILNMADVILVLSESLKEFIESITSNKRIELFSNTVKLPDLSIVQNREYGNRRITFLGRICKDKGIEELLAAFNIIKNEYSDIKLYVGGIFEDKKYEYEILNNKNIEYLGWISGEKKADILLHSDVLVLPSYYEGFPVSVLDGMSYGCAVVATGVGAVTDVIEDGIDGIIINPRDVNSLVDGIKKVLLDSDRMRQIGLKGREKVSNNFDINKSINALVAIYGDLYRDE